LAERIDILRNNSARYQPAVYKTHALPSKLEIRHDAKYIIIVRNFVDAVASLKPFLHNHGSTFKDMWGGFPPQAGTELSSLDEEHFENYVLNDMGGGAGMMEVFLENFVRGWWKYRRHPNVLFMHYLDRLRTPHSEISKIASFIGIKLSEDELSSIVMHTSFDYMKKYSSKFNIEHILDPYKEKGLVANDVRFIAADLVCVGSARNGSAELPSSLVKNIEKTLESKFGRQVSAWIQRGGPLPDVDIEPIEPAVK
jgi:Sulfotransferase domain